MTKKLFIFIIVVGLFVLGALACFFPAKIDIKGGTIPSAAERGQALINADAGCDCETNWVSGQMQYVDGPARVSFTSELDFQAGDQCYVDEAELAQGRYTPLDSKDEIDQGDFYIGIFNSDHPDYDEENCADCELCYRLYLEGGKYDGYQNWACELKNNNYTSEPCPESE